MLTRLTDLQKAFAYYVLAFGACTTVALLAPFFGERTPLVAMFTPLVAVLVMLLVLTRDGYAADGWQALGIHRAGLRAWGVALAVPLLVLGFSFGTLWSSGAAELAAPVGAAELPSSVLDVVLSIGVVTLTAGLAEEIGWRGYFLPRSMSLGARRAVLLTGFLHGVWHLPVMLATPYYHADGSPLVVVPSFLLALILAGVCYGYLRLTTASVWPAALAHAAFNVLWERFRHATVATSPATLELLAGESGLFTLAALAVAAAWFDRRLSRAVPAATSFVVADAAATRTGK